jgi:hypothetical protein
VVIVTEVPTALSELGPYGLRRISAFRTTEHSLTFSESERTVISEAQCEANICIKRKK